MSYYENMPDEHSLDSMEGIYFDLEEIRNKGIELWEQLEIKVGHKMMATLSGNSNPLPLRQSDWRGREFEEELRKIDNMLAKKAFLAILLDSISYIAEEKDTKKIIEHVGHYLQKIVGEHRYLERNKEFLSEDDSRFLSEVFEVVGDYFSLMPAVFFKREAAHHYSKALSMLDLDKELEKDRSLILQNKIDRNKSEIVQLKSKGDDIYSSYDGSSQQEESVDKFKTNLFGVLHKYKNYIKNISL